MKGFNGNIEQLTLANEQFRTVLYTSLHAQLTVMRLQPREDIGEEVHDVDQFLRIEAGTGRAMLDGDEVSLADGSVVIVPAGVRHNIINDSETEPMKLYSLYCPPHHKDGVVHATKEEALADDEHFDGVTTD